MYKKGFSNELYVEKQAHEIKERIAKFDGKLYLEFGGKLFDDFHASRVLPGFEPDAEIKLLQALSEDTEIIFDRVDYIGVVLTMYRSNNNEMLDIDRISYFHSLMEAPKETYGMRIITTKGMYNEVMDDSCNGTLCNTKLELDKDFSKYFNDIVYSNGKYIFTKSNPTTIYNIEKYVKSK